ncbi:type I restriction enzyme HsdR N-terminal domain-containing protein [Algoriphagus pacificus]|uniref:Type I restriction enzyme HsdR N-terminal domain-containing protein n=1 Tax=Algoriphagus pacificus TaxID=2811234 RepID=A0ABS3CGG8_9BACT|nr:type I restriction enzyme HsdR N-terminal domain-containing protein [Algoriphagus pacificus]MBN7815624.1 type I restriction enzyme HsdR N-terminal domain-containing protein [Algoriphagus pacificus]
MKQDLNRVQLPILNLPPFEPKLQEIDGKLGIFDSLRKKYLILTPEEWVRQHWINYLIHHLSFPKGLVALEKGLTYNQLQKRTDLVVWNNEGNPYLLIECKAPQIKLSQKTMEQACLYHQEIKSKFLIISNGQQHVSLEWNADEKKFIQLKHFPSTPN